ncbi:acyl-CoA N-acyltransferase [Nadsonia fulvescens var. elongata DSM 6958]|uniref:Acyl-CoA N-acyltransferase n=1 Tax=Nadsonia fulvescens var. elongata DSM 6958 TaxID=857566 RepID=A0A1E3PH22_9ASCO|nr:acyl-CoA N-acyltransferase [Nadsonia fulvescens var. elongata DSM 6958]
MNSVTASLPANLYLRNLSLADLDQVDKLESQAFSENERASREKIAYRLRNCADICFGLFQTCDDPNAEILVGHTLSTKTNSFFITDQAMEMPELDPVTHTPVSEQEKLGHLPTGPTVALHSLAVAKNFRKQGLAQVLMKYTAEAISSDNATTRNRADRISIIVHGELVPFYQHLGYKDNGPSKCAHGGEKWNDMWLEL